MDLVGNVTSMARLFRYNRKFDRQLKDWDVARVTSMKQMFQRSHYNRPLNKWKTEKLRDASYMFNDAVNFDRDLGQSGSVVVVLLFR